MADYKLEITVDLDGSAKVKELLRGELDLDGHIYNVLPQVIKYLNEKLMTCPGCRRVVKKLHPDGETFMGREKRLCAKCLEEKWRRK